MELEELTKALGRTREGLDANVWLNKLLDSKVRDNRIRDTGAYSGLLRYKGITQQTWENLLAQQDEAMHLEILGKYANMREAVELSAMEIDGETGHDETSHKDLEALEKALDQAVNDGWLVELSGSMYGLKKAWSKKILEQLLKNRGQDNEAYNNHALTSLCADLEDDDINELLGMIETNRENALVVNKLCAAVVERDQDNTKPWAEKLFKASVGKPGQRYALARGLANTQNKVVWEMIIDDYITPSLTQDDQLGATELVVTYTGAVAGDIDPNIHDRLMDYLIKLDDWDWFNSREPLEECKAQMYGLDNNFETVEEELYQKILTERGGGNGSRVKIYRVVGRKLLGLTRRSDVLQTVLNQWPVLGNDLENILKDRTAKDTTNGAGSLSATNEKDGWLQDWDLEGRATIRSFNYVTLNEQEQNELLPIWVSWLKNGQELTHAARINIGRYITEQGDSEQWCELGLEDALRYLGKTRRFDAYVNSIIQRFEINGGINLLGELSTLTMGELEAVAESLRTETSV